ncbi:MAG: cation:proton antiporter, partial [Myxococcales bacterium]|nr:cation:proton antiporter [Myxococcales bacterium]
MRRASPATRHQHGAAIILHETNPLLTLAVILAAGVAGGLAAGRLRLPSVTGQILIGIVIGPSLLGLVGKPQTQGLAPITDFALGLIAVAVGSHLNFRRLRNAGKRLALLLLFEVTLTPVLVFAAVYGISGAGVAGFALALLLAPMAVETAPATTLALVKETHSKGVFVKTLVAGVALNNMACLVLFEIAHTAAQLWLNPNSTTAGVRLALEPAKSVAVSALIGVTAALVLTGTTRRWLGADRRAAASLIAILGAAGLGEQLGGSALLACLFLGMTLANVAPDRDGLGHTVFGQLETAIFAVFFTLELFGFHGHPYAGILAYLIVPALFVAGLLLIPIGLRLARRRAQTGKQLPVIDLNVDRTRNRVLVFVALTALNIVIVAVAAYKGVEVMDTTAFCGETCHSVMEPEHTAFQRGAHASARCIDCHIGPGASWFVKSKLSGSWQVVSVALDLYPRPIPTPVENLRPARETCEQCHWPQKFVG